MLDITTILTAVITFITTVLAVFAMPWLRAKIGADNWAQLVSIARIAVLAAEQMFRGTKQGAQKLEEATAAVKAAMAAHGLRYDDTVIRAAIEAAVRELKIA